LDERFTGPFWLRVQLGRTAWIENSRPPRRDQGGVGSGSARGQISILNVAKNLS